MPAPATIVALSSGQPPCAIAVIRVSGPETGAILTQLVGRPPPPREATLRVIRDPRTADPIDRGLVLWFPGPGSFSGEDSAEFHVHGGRAVVNRLLKCLTELAGVRLAEPGEFTRRAFENGQVDLSSVEGLSDLIAADTDAQRRQALRQMNGELAAACDRWRSNLLDARAWIEADLDFADEEDIPANVSDRHWTLLRETRASFARALADDHRGERIRDGLQIVLLGRPNAGKSSLLNALARRDAAIVTEEAGTTRDIVEVAYDIGGYPARLLDTAGLRAASGVVEQEGMRRARKAAGAADLILWVTDATIPDRPDQDIMEVAAESATPIWHLINKIDLTHLEPDVATDSPTKQIRLSAKTGEGVEQFIRHIQDFVSKDLRLGEPVLITRLRHRQALKRACTELDGVLADRSLAPELIVEHIRRASAEIGRIAGDVDVEEVLGRIFAEFCIGK